MTSLVGQTAVETFEVGGVSALDSYLTRLAKTSAVHATLLNDRLEDVSGQPVERTSISLPIALTIRLRSSLSFQMVDLVIPRRMEFS